MTDRTINSNIIAADRAVTADTGDVITVLAGATVAARGAAATVSAIFSSGSDVTVNVSGEVSGATGIRLGDDPAVDDGHVINVRATGSVIGDNAIQLAGSDLRLSNAGSIFGTFTGLALTADGEGTSAVVNSGTIAGQAAALFLNGPGQAFSISNTGRLLGLQSDGLAILVSGSFNGSVTLFNSGLIDGDIDLGSGNDRYDGATGRVTGTIFGDDGNDRFILGTRAERIDGGDGIDTVAIAGRAGARIALDNDAANGGRARGDTFANIENAVGSSRGSDGLRGSDAANLLDGQGGRDRLGGLGGDDTLVGGAGRDRMAGGTGDDAFLFRSASHGGDRITDFRSSAGNDDGFRFDDAGFAGLDDGALDASAFRTRASSNAAGDADDRFIFRTTDATLWYDADGRGGARSVLVADLQTGAVVTAADIEIF